jgi:hypothetical protein
MKQNHLHSEGFLACIAHVWAFSQSCPNFMRAGAATIARDFAAVPLFSLNGAKDSYERDAFIPPRNIRQQK